MKPSAIILSLLIAALTSFRSAPPLPFEPNFVLIQGKTAFPLKNYNTNITIEKAPFKLQFNSKEYNPDKNELYATRVAITVDKKEADKIKPGVRMDDLEYFAPGTGNATLGPYKAFSLTSNYGGHQYIIYQKSDEKRATLLKEENSILRLECTVSNLFFDGKSHPIKTFAPYSMYIILLNDTNLNGLVEEGEYKIATITFD